MQNINPTRSSAVLGSREKTLYGPGFVLDTLCGTQFAISSRSFYQVNRTQTEVLYKKALELAGPKGFVVICGCLHMASDIRGLLQNLSDESVG